MLQCMVQTQSIRQPSAYFWFKNVCIAKDKEGKIKPKAIEEIFVEYA